MIASGDLTNKNQSNAKFHHQKYPKVSKSGEPTRQVLDFQLGSPPLKSAARNRHPGFRMTATSPAPERYLEHAKKTSEYLHKVFAGPDLGRTPRNNDLASYGRCCSKVFVSSQLLLDTLLDYHWKQTLDDDYSRLYDIISYHILNSVFSHMNHSISSTCASCKYNATSTKYIHIHTYTYTYRYIHIHTYIPMHIHIYIYKYTYSLP